MNGQELIGKRVRVKRRVSSLAEPEGVAVEMRSEEYVFPVVVRDKNGVEMYYRASDLEVIEPGHPLDGLEDGATPSASDCECGDPEGCRAAHDEANRVPLPTGDELLALMNEASF